MVTPPWVSIQAGQTGVVLVGPVKSACAWGSDRFGQSTVPELNGVLAIAAADGESFALRGDGTVVTWGFLGDCETASVVHGLTAISAGRDHVLGIRTDGSFVAWGADDAQQTNVPSDARAVAT